MNVKVRAACGASALAMSVLAGCEGRPSLFPNSDPALQKTSTQFAADASRRFPYPATSPRAGDAKGRAQVDLTFGTLQIINYGEDDWHDVDIWVNRTYVCHLPRVARRADRVETLNFQMLYNADGHYFSTDGGKNPMREVEMRRDGKMYQIPLVLAD